MPAPVRRPTTQAPRPRIATVFWSLARNSGAQTESRDPDDVVWHLLASLDALEGSRPGTDIAADALTVLLRLEQDAHYAAPEQIRGGERDAQALVYSIGVLLFERLTGHHPFFESVSPMSSALARDRSRRVGKNNLCSLPERLRRILDTALSAFPENRYDNVTELRVELESFACRAATMVDASFASRPRDLVARARSRRGSEPPPCPGSPERWIHDAIRALGTSPPPPLPPRSGSVVKPAPSVPLVPRVARAERVVEPISLPRQRRRRRIRKPALLIGGAVAISAAAVTLAILTHSDARGSETKPALATPPHATATAPAVTPAPQKEPPASEPLSADRAEPDRSRRAAPPADSDPPFSAERGGDRAALAARDCFTPERLVHGVEVGVSLRFDAADGHVGKIYFANDPNIHRDDRHCLEEAFAGLTAGAAPERTTMVTYTLWLSRSASHHRVHSIE